MVKLTGQQVEIALSASLPNLDVHWTSTGGGCMAIEVSQRRVDRTAPYRHLLITGEDVYTEDEYFGFITGSAKFPADFFSIGYYDEDGELRDTDTTAVIGVIGLIGWVNSVAATWPSHTSSAVVAVLAQLEIFETQERKEILTDALAALEDI